MIDDLRTKQNCMSSIVGRISMCFVAQKDRKIARTTLLRQEPRTTQPRNLLGKKERAISVIETTHPHLQAQRLPTVLTNNFDQTQCFTLVSVARTLELLEIHRFQLGPRSVQRSGIKLRMKGCNLSREYCEKKGYPND